MCCESQGGSVRGRERVCVDTRLSWIDKEEQTGHRWVNNILSHGHGGFCVLSRRYLNLNKLSKAHTAYILLSMSRGSYFRYNDDIEMKYEWCPNHCMRNGWNDDNMNLVPKPQRALGYYECCWVFVICWKWGFTRVCGRYHIACIYVWWLIIFPNLKFITTQIIKACSWNL